MKQNTLIRSDKPHAVKMPAGSNVAQRKSPPKATVPDQPPQALPNIQKVTPSKATKVQRPTTPAPSGKTARSKVTLNRPVESAAPPPKPKTTAAKAVKSKAKERSANPKSSTIVHPPAPTEPLWERDNPIKARIEQLRILNAQLAEQLQRLQTTPTARGKRP